MNYTTPEQKGISSEKIGAFIDRLEKNHLSSHDLIFARGDDIFFETYWAPFKKDDLHRMYSVSKSFVSMAIGFLVSEGKLSLDDPISKYFPEESEDTKNEDLRRQTVRDMLMMSTSQLQRNWFEVRTDDRVAVYFENSGAQSRPSGTTFWYDSSGSFVLGALVEKLSGMPLLSYLRARCLDEIGFSKEAYCLKCPGGHSWGDSAIICKPTDLLKAARFMLNGGKWNGKQLLDADYVKAATSKQLDNNLQGEKNFDTCGYGYQFWITYQNSFYFFGMGSQFAVCVPGKDLIMIYNGDNQGCAYADKVIMDSFFELIVDPASDKPLADDPKALQALEKRCETLSLSLAEGNMTSPLASELNGKVFTMDPNPMGISKLSFTFNGNKGKLSYTNGQGDKELLFGFGHQEIGNFPEEGYSDEIGSQYAAGRYYRCAASAAWVEPQKLYLNVQIIDTYFGRLHMTFGFRNGRIGVYMTKTAEDFLDKYQGFAGGIVER